MPARYHILSPGHTGPSCDPLSGTPKRGRVVTIYNMEHLLSTKCIRMGHKSYSIQEPYGAEGKISLTPPPIFFFFPGPPVQHFADTTRPYFKMPYFFQPPFTFLNQYRVFHVQIFLHKCFNHLGQQSTLVQNTPKPSTFH